MADRLNLADSFEEYSEGLKEHSGPLFRAEDSFDLAAEYQDWVSRGLGSRSMAPHGDEGIGDILSGFAQTALYEAGPGLIGVEPWEDVESFQRDHPGLALGAFFAGVAVPYGFGLKLGTKAARALPGLSKVVKFTEAEERVREMPHLMKGARTAAEFTPFELVRLGAAAAVPGGDLGETGTHVAFELPFIGAAEAGLSKALAARPFKRIAFKGEGLLADIFGADSAQPYKVNLTPQERLESISKILKNTTEQERSVMHSDLETTIFSVQDELQQLVVRQEPPKGVGYVSKLEGEIGPPEKGKRLAPGRSASATADKFKVGVRPNYSIRFMDGRKKPKGLGGRDEVEKIKNRLGVSDEQLGMHTQYRRIIEATNETGAKRLQEFFKPWMYVGRASKQAYLAKEEDGLFIYAQKVAGRALQAKEGDKWFITKTTKPGLFHPDAEKFGELQIRNGLHHDLEAILGPEVTGVEPLNFVWQLKKALFAPDLAGPEVNRVTKMIREHLTPEQEKIRRELVDSLRHYKNEFKTFTSPALHEFKDSRIAGTVMSIARAAYQRAHARASRIFHGTPVGEEEGTLTRAIFRGQKRQGGIEQAIDRLSVEDVAKVDQAWNMGLSVSEARSELKLSKEAQQFLRLISKTDGQYIDDTVRIQDLFPEGELKDKFVPMPNHYMITRTWRGDFRVPVFETALNDQGVHFIPAGAKPRGYGSGYSRSEAIEDAKKVISKAHEMEGEGGIRLAFREQDTMRVGRDTDLALARQVDLDLAGARLFNRARNALHVAEPKRYKHRKGMVGYKTDLSHRELKRIIYGNIIETERTNTQRAIKLLLGEEITTATQHHARIGASLNKRLNALAGERGEVSQKLDEFFDRFLGDVFGKGAAGEIVRKTNHAMFALMLGMGDLGFATMNALTPIQTLMPEVAWQLTATPSKLAEYMTPSLVLSRNGPHTIRTLDPLRVMRRGFKAMRNPDAEAGDLRHWFNKAMEEGIISPRFVEEFAGRTAGKARLSNVLKGEESFAEYMVKLAEFFPAISEELSRGYSYTTGFILGRDFFGLSGQRLHQYASEVVARSNYLYTVADRPRFITGSIGSLFGLFKNWSLHYAANMMSYTGEAALRGNFSPALFGMVGTGLLAGVGGLPLYGAADGMAKILTDKPLMQSLYEGFGYGEDSWVPGKDTMIDAVHFGLPGLVGVSLQGRAAPTGNSMIRDMTFLFQSATLERAKILGQAIGDSIDWFRSTGQHPVNTARIRNAYVRAFMPRTLIRAMSRTEDRALVSIKSGNRIMSDMTMPQYVSYILGFTPLDFEKAYEISNSEFARQDKMKALTSTYGRALMEAEDEGDPRRISDLLKRAIIDGVDVQSMQRSAESFRSKSELDTADRQFDAYRVMQLKRAFYGR